MGSRTRRLWVAVCGGFAIVAASVGAMPHGKTIPQQGAMADRVKPVRRPTPPNPYRGGLDQTPPRIDRLTPSGGPWIVDSVGLSAVTIGFDEPVLVPVDAVAVWGVGSGTFTNFITSYDDGTRTLTILFDAPVREGRLTVVLDHRVTDLAGNPLDGEIPQAAAPTLPSGDGQVGGAAVFRFNILQGDATRDGVVDDDDAAALLPGLGRCVGDADYDAGIDLGGDGCINVLDAAAFLLGEGASLPELDGTAPFVTQIQPDPEMPLIEPLIEVLLRFSEAMDPERILVDNCYLVDSSGGLHDPLTASPSPDGLSAVYTFASPLPLCDVYMVRISNSAADMSGMLLSPPDAAPRLVGATVPPPPTLFAHQESTRALTIVLDGDAPGASTVEILTHEAALFAPVTDGSYALAVPLPTNRVSRFFLTAISPCGGARSAPLATTVIQDTQPPELHIDYPIATETSLAVTAVSGHVTDILTGTGMLVLVDGTLASLRTATGGGLTFLVRDVPLDVGANSILVIASDGLGNTKEVSIDIVRLDVPKNVEQVLLLSGNGQTGQTGTVLADPLAVRVTRRDGSPLADKIVTFRVIRSDSRLSLDGLGDGQVSQAVRADATGVAQAFVHLGKDVGAGHIQVMATSESIEGDPTFLLSATPAIPMRINILSGDHQRVEAGATAPERLFVRVSDGRNGVAGMPVTFRVIEGGGSLLGAPEVVTLTNDNGVAAATFVLGPSGGSHIVEVTHASLTEAPARFTLLGIERRESHATGLSGVILSTTGLPLQGVNCTLRLGGSVVATVASDLHGQFRFDDLLASGVGLLLIDGETAFHVGGANGQDVAPERYPPVSLDVVVVPGVENAMATPIFLPFRIPTNNRSYRVSQDTVLGIDGMAGLSFVIKAGSMSIDGLPAPDFTDVSLQPVHHDKLPVPLSGGAASPLAWLLLPSDATFDPPVEVVYPNLSASPAGAMTSLLQLHPVLNRFCFAARLCVSADAATMTTPEGEGLTHGGFGAIGLPSEPTERACLCLPTAPPLDDTWVVRVNGRSTIVHPDGTFLVSNIPALDAYGGDGPGSAPDALSDALMRVTGVSLDGGITRYIQSACFRIASGDVFAVDPLAIAFDPPVSIEQLVVIPELFELDGVGASGLVYVVAVYSDGSSSLIDPSFECLVMRTSNPDVLMVDDTGLVTVIGAGTAIITATGDGASSSASITATVATATTTVEGFVMLPDGVAVEGAQVSVIAQGGSTTTGSDGRFSISGVSSDLGDIEIFAEHVVGVTPLSGTSAMLMPVAGGLTDAGLLVVRAGPVRWILNIDGSWHDGGNWNTGAVPELFQNVVIDRPGVDVIVTYATGDSLIVSIDSEEHLRLIGGSLAMELASQFDGPLTLDGGTLSGNGTLDVNGPFSWRSGEVRGDGSMNINGGLTLSGSTNRSIRQRTVRLKDSAAWVGDGDINMHDGAALQISPAASLEVLASQSGIRWSSGFPAPSFENDGLLTVDIGSGSMFSVEVPLINRGRIELPSGTLSLVGTYTQTAPATLHLTDGIVSSSASLVIVGGRIEGVGTIIADVSLQQATIASEATGSGLLRVEGDLTVGSSATLDIALAGILPGADFGRLDVIGHASLDGTLSITLVEGYVPSEGDSFEIMTFGSRDGTFTTITGDDLGSGFGLLPIYTSGSLTLAVVAP